jgi:tetratricopeptide (TPR) repeat protein
MNYLHDLINVLKDDELEQVRALQLPQRQRDVLHTMLSFRHRELPQVPELLKALDISSQHFYKVNSVLLDKCYELFVPERGEKLLAFLAVKDLYRHLFHEMRLQEKALLKSSPESIAEFYRQCFELLQSQSVKNFNEEAIREFGVKYLSAKKNKTAGDELYIEARLLRSEMISIGARAQNVEERQRIFKKVSELDERFKNVAHPMAEYWLHHAWAQYYAALHEGEDFAHHMLGHLLKALEICDTSPEICKGGERAFTVSKIAEAYYGESDFLKAFEMYDALFKSGEIESQKRFYHTTKFVQICIILGEYARAQELLDDQFGVYIASRERAMTTMGSISYAKLYLASGDLLKAKEFIDLGFELNTKNYYVQYEIELRNLQNTYFFLKEDWELAEDLARRNLKFLTSKGFTMETSAYGFFYKMVLAFINTKIHNAKFPESLEPRFEQYQQSYFAVYGKLLKIMREKAESRVENLV